MKKLVGIVIGLFVLTLVFSPLFHWFYWGLLYMHPMFWVAVLLVAVIVRMVWDRDSKNLGYDEIRWRSIVAIVLGVLFLIFGGFWADGVMKTALVKEINPQPLDKLPSTTEIRYLPMSVAEKFGANKIQDPRHHLGDMDPIDNGKEFDWVAPRIPTGLFNALFDQMDGIVIVKSNGDVETIPQVMACGEGMAFWADINWAMMSKSYWVEYPEIYYLRLTTGEVVSVAPYIRYKFQFPIQVPSWGGVMVVHSDCTIEDLSPYQAVNDLRFTGQRLFPEKLVSQIADAWGYKGGVANAWFTHYGQTEVPKITGEKNQMPYLVPTEDGPMWFVGLEPYGPAYSIYKIMYFDAHSGDIMMYEVSDEAGMVSPEKAAGYVKAAFPNYGWYSSGDKTSSGNILAIEPKPMVKDNVLYWQVSITSADYSGVTRTALLNARDNKVVYFENLFEIQQFIAGKFLGHSVTTAPTCDPLPVSVSPQGDLNGLSIDQLLRLQQLIIEELIARNLSK